MNILVTSIVDPQATPHSRLHQFLESLATKHAVTVVAPRDTWKTSYDRAPSADTPFDVKYLSGGHPFLQEPQALFRLRSLLDPHILKDAHIHFDYNSLFLGMATRRLLRRYGTLTVYDLADDLPAMAGSSQQVPPLLRPVAETVAGQLLRSNIRSAARVTVTVDALAAAFSVPKGKYVVIPNGVSFQRFTMRPEKTVHTPMRVVFVGALREWIRLEHVLRALPNNAELVVAGGEGIKRTMQLVKDFGIPRRVRFLGIVPYRKLPALLQEMDAGILPFAPGSVSDYAAPLKFFEYAAAGLPIISTSIPEVVRLGRNEVIIADSPEAWRRAFMNVQAHYGEVRAKALKLRRRLRSFDWNIITTMLEHVLKQTANRHQ